MPQFNRREFDAFVADRNAQAPFDHMLHGLSGPPDELDEDANQMRLTVGGWLDEVLSGAAVLEDEARLNLRDVLSDRVAALLRKRDPASRRRSMLDVVTTGRVTDVQVDQLFKGYDVDLTDPKGLAYATEVFGEAAKFFDAYVVHGEGSHAKVPPALKHLESKPAPRSIYRVFKTAAGVEGRPRDIPIACALLRIAHVIDLAKTHPRIQAVNELHPTILHRLNECISPLASGGFVFKTRPGDPGIRLTGFSIRPKHPFSIYAKLLHKPEVDVESIRDLLGCLFRTQNPQDTLKLMYALFFDPDDAVFPPFLVDPRSGDQLLFDAQSLNEALLDPSSARALVERMADSIPREDMTHAALDLYSGNGAGRNPHSSEFFRILKTVHGFRVSRNGRGSTRSRGGVIFPSTTAEMVPVEFQYADDLTLYANAALAPHEHYKARQRDAVRGRLLEGNLWNAYNASR